MEHKTERRIAIGTITRGRPDLLVGLLETYAKMKRPEDDEIAFIVVENEVEKTLGSVIENFDASVPEQVVYENEPNSGIVPARNHVLQIALDQGYDILTFCDDDEKVSETWLVNLIGGLDEGGYDLVSGPLMPEPLEPNLGIWQHALYESATRRDEQAREKNKDPIIAQAQNAATNNWAFRLDFARTHGMRFDVSRGMAGGSDTKFSIDVRRFGGRVGWVPNALVSDRIPSSRLKLGVQYRRTKGRAINSVNLHGKSKGQTLKRVISNVVEAIVLMIGSIVMGPKMFVRAAMKIADAHGRILSLFGGRVDIYAPDKLT